MVAKEGQKRVLPYYKYVSWLFPVLKVIAPRIINDMSQVGQAMIEAVLHGYEKNVIEVKDISLLSGRANSSTL
jgi:hypothetical protein